MKKLRLIFVAVLLLYPCAALPDETHPCEGSGPGDVACCTAIAQGAQNQCANQIVTQGQQFCEAQAVAYCASYALQHCADSFCTQYVYQQCMMSLTPQMIYSCILSYMASTGYVCSNVYE